MTGAEKFSDMVARFEFASLEVNESMRSNVLCGWICEGTLGLADELLNEHDYGGAHDVVRLGSALMRQFASKHISELDDDGKQVAVAILQRMNGRDVKIVPPPEADPDLHTIIDANALSDEELRMLGLEPEHEPLSDLTDPALHGNDPVAPRGSGHSQARDRRR